MIVLQWPSYVFFYFFSIAVFFSVLVSCISHILSNTIGGEKYEKKVIMLVDLAPGGWWDLEGKATQTFYLGITQTAFELVKRPDNG